jgi:hypothetical protein
MASHKRFRNTLLPAGVAMNAVSHRRRRYQRLRHLGVPMTTCYDSTSPDQIPADAPIVAGYIDGLYAWSAAQWARFPGQHVTITVFGAAGARVADVERGDLTPAQGADWARREIAAGRRPTIYSDRSTWPEVIKLLGSQALQVDWWAADPTGTSHLVPGSVCTQYAWNSLGQTGGLNVDISLNKRDMAR